MNADGTWSYVVDSTDADTQALVAAHAEAMDLPSSMV